MSPSVSLTPAAAAAIAATVRAVRNAPAGRADLPNPFNSSFPGNFYFPVQVSKDGGVAGSLATSTSCNFTYSLFDQAGNAMKDGSGTAITGLTPDVPRIANCAYNAPAPKSPGVAYRTSSGTIKLYHVAQEIPTTVVATDVTGLQISGTAIQYKTNTRLVLDQGTESGWTTLDAGTTCT